MIIFKNDDEVEKTNWEERYRLESELNRARQTIRLAKVRALKFPMLLERVRNIEKDVAPSEVSFAIQEGTRSLEEDLQLVAVLKELLIKAETLPYKEKDRLDRLVKAMLYGVPSSLISEIVVLCLSSNRKTRREIGLRFLDYEDSDMAEFLFQRYQETSDKIFLTKALKYPLPLSVLDPLALLNAFEKDDDYWRMRVVEAALKADINLKTKLSYADSKAFIHACGRSSSAELVFDILDCYNRSNNKQMLIGITAWAFGKLGAVAELEKLEADLIEFEKMI